MLNNILKNLCLIFLGLWAPSVFSTSAQTWHYDFYSETLSAVEYSGVINQNRLRLLYRTFPHLDFYAGLFSSNDWTRQTTLRYAEDYVAPGTGVLYRPFSFLGLFAEYRYLLHTENYEGRKSDPRYGAYLYDGRIWWPQAHVFTESYAEAVTVTTLNHNPIATAFVKLGSDIPLRSSLFIAPYFEVYYRESPSLLLGIDDFSLRAGGRLKVKAEQLSGQILIYRKFYSERTPIGWEALFVLAADGAF